MSAPVLPAPLPERYQALRQLGRGGFGTVILARDLELGRQVAVKLLDLNASDPQLRGRFEREARVTGGLHHPHIVEVYDSGISTSGHPYIVYQFVEGATLPENGGGDPGEVRRWAKAIASALATVHQAGLIHRDVKPANVLITASSEAILCDFGIVREVGPLGPRTATGMILGTPAYMAPEIFSGGPPSPAADQFAWGVCFLRVLTGRGAYPSNDPVEILQGVSKGYSPPEISLPADPNLAEILRRSLAGEPVARFGQMNDIVVALEGLGGATPKPRAAVTVVGIDPGPLSAQTEAASLPTKPKLRSNLAGWGRVVTAVALVAVGGFLSLSASRTPPLPKAQEIVPAPPYSPFPPDYIVRLNAEWSDYLDSRESALEEVRVRGFRVIEELPELSRFFAWLAEAEDPSRLPSELKKGLREYDRQLIELGLLPIFTPLIATPALEQWSEESLGIEALALPPSVLKELEPSHLSVRDRAAFRSLREALGARATANQALAKGEWPTTTVGLAEIVLVKEKFPLKIFMDTNLHRARDSPEFQAILAKLLQPGQDAFRRFLYQAARALDTPSPRRHHIARIYRRATRDLAPFLSGVALSAHPSWFLGRLPRTPEGWYLRAVLIRGQYFQAPDVPLRRPKLPPGERDLLRAAAYSFPPADELSVRAEQSDVWNVLMDMDRRAGDSASLKETRERFEVSIAAPLSQD